MKKLIRRFFKFLIIFTILPTVSLLANSKNTNTSGEGFDFEKGEKLKLQGKIIGNRYLSPHGMFSCHAEDFKSKVYSSEDSILNINASTIVSVSFYDASGVSKKAVVLQDPMIIEETVKKEKIEKFLNTNMQTLQKNHNAKGIKSIERVWIDEGTLFTSVSIDSTDDFVSKADGSPVPFTEAYLAFQEKDKNVLLSIRTPVKLKNRSKEIALVKNLRNNLLHFKRSFVFTPQIKR